MALRSWQRAEVGAGPTGFLYHGAPVGIDGFPYVRTVASPVALVSKWKQDELRGCSTG